MKRRGQIISEPVEDKEDGGGPEEGVPEPEGQVDLLVDDVLRQDAQTVVVLEKDADRKRLLVKACVRVIKRRDVKISCQCSRSCNSKMHTVIKNTGQILRHQCKSKT